MNPSLNLLVIEDSPADFSLLERHLKKNGTTAYCRCVSTLEELKAAMEDGSWDAVLSDYTVPGMEFGETLHFLKSTNPDLPLILVAGSVGEEMAVELFKQGVWDFVLKNNLTRLGPAIERSLREATERRARQSAEESLRASEKRYRSLFENMLNGYAFCRMIFDHDVPRDFIFVDVNRAFGTLTGLKNVEGRRATELIPGIQKENPGLVELYGRVVRTGVPEKTESYVESLKMWLSISVYSPLHQHFVLVFDVITERKRAEEALRESERAFRTLAESMPQIVWACGADGLITYFNQQWIHYTGLTWEVSRGTGWNIPFHPEDRLRAWNAWQHSVEEGQVFELECRLRRVDEVYRWWLVRGIPHRDASGKIIKWFGTYTDIDDLKQAEAAARENRSKLDAALGSMTDAVFISDGDGKFIEFNEAFAKFHRFKNKGECARRLSDYPDIIEVSFANGEPAPLDQWAVARALAGESVTNAEYIIRRKDTRETWVGSYSFNPIRDKNGAIVGSVVVGRDITEQKQAEVALRESEKRLRFVTENTRIGLVVLNRERRYTFANTAYAEILGLPSANIIGERVADVLAPLYDEQISPRLDRAFAGERVSYELKMPTPGGDKYYAVTYEPNKVKDEEMLVVVVISDITERKQKTEELRSKTAFLEALVSSSMDGILVVDNQRRKILQNQRAIDLWKIPKEIAEDPDANRQYHFAREQTRNPEDFSERSERIHFRSDEFIHDEIELKDGTVLERQTSLIKAPDGKCYGRFWTFRDSTKGRQLEAQLRQAQKMEAIGTLAGGIAHDFNNILAAMFGYAYLLEQDLAENVAARESLAEILNAAERAKDLVQQILTFSRQREQKRQVLSLGTIVKEVMKFLRASLPSNIKIEVNLASDTPNVLADPTQVHQVVMNLATNAFHAMEDTNGQLTANLDRFEPGAEFIRSHPEFRALAYARLILADTGHGMDARTLERIYEPFFTTKPLGKGTGLGLAVVHGIIRSHEGIISVESSVGQGTTFYLYLPAHTAGGTPVQKPNHSVAAGQGQRILFLDDEPVLTSLFQRQLQRLNYNVTTTNSAREAIGLVEKNPASFDLLITDLTMPEISGLEVARQIHRLRPDLPIILATGFNAALNENDLHSAGICKLMEKPITATALAATVARAIKKDDEPVPGGTEVPVG